MRLLSAIEELMRLKLAAEFGREKSYIGEKMMKPNDWGSIISRQAICESNKITFLLGHAISYRE